MNEDNKNMETLTNTITQQQIQQKINLLTKQSSQPQLLQRESSPASSISSTSSNNNNPNVFNVKTAEWPSLDEFILELLSKPAERLFLLKLEQDLIQFVKNHQMYRLDLPGMNSYQRLMIHKVAPYFNLSHFYDPAKQSIFLCKNPYTDVPPISFSDAVKQPENGDSSNQNAFKIMRRTPINNHGHRHRHSNHHHQHQHHHNYNNDDESSEDKKKILSYEERKTAYEIARARIFSDLEEKQSSST
ncbi:unnamed protein product [Cunninghamella blakesleeana]